MKKQINTIERWAHFVAILFIEIVVALIIWSMLPPFEFFPRAIYFMYMPAIAAIVIAWSFSHLACSESNIFEENGIVFARDPHDRGFTVFFREMPLVIAEGDTKDEAVYNLITTIRTAIYHDGFIVN